MPKLIAGRAGAAGTIGCLRFFVRLAERNVGSHLLLRRWARRPSVKRQVMRLRNWPSAPIQIPGGQRLFPAALLNMRAPVLFPPV